MLHMVDQTESTLDSRRRGGRQDCPRGRQRGTGGRRTVHDGSAEVQDQEPEDSVDVVGTRIPGDLPV